MVGESMKKTLPIFLFPKLSQMKMKKLPTLSCLLCAYIALCVFYFLPVRLDHKIVLPLLLLSVVGLRLQPLPMLCAMIFSAAGDYAGSCHNFPMQMGAFALAHIAFITYFSKIVFDRRHSHSLSAFIMSSLLASVLFILAVTLVFPSVTDTLLAVGVAIYIVLIILMLFFAGLTGECTFLLGALLFVISDSILGWNKFVEKIPYSAYWILIPYFSAQILLFTQSAILHQRKQA